IPLLRHNPCQLVHADRKRSLSNLGCQCRPYPFTASLEQLIEGLLALCVPQLIQKRVCQRIVLTRKRLVSVQGEHVAVCRATKSPTFDAHPDNAFGLQCRQMLPDGDLGDTQFPCKLFRRHRAVALDRRQNLLACDPVCSWHSRFSSVRLGTLSACRFPAYRPCTDHPIRSLR